MSAQRGGASRPNAGELLRNERSRTIEAIADLDVRIDGIVFASADSNSDDEHDPDGATIAFEREQARALRRAARQRLSEIRDAMARLDAGTYGVCAVCGKPIPAGRLEARPTAATCLEHASDGRGTS